MIIPRKVININVTRRCTIEQNDEFLRTSHEVDFSAHGGQLARYAHIADVLKRFGNHQRDRHDRGVCERLSTYASRYDDQARAEPAHQLDQSSVMRAAEEIRVLLNNGERAAG